MALKTKMRALAQRLFSIIKGITPAEGTLPESPEDAAAAAEAAAAKAYREEYLQRRAANGWRRKTVWVKCGNG